MVERFTGMNYGAITPTDAEVMDAALDQWQVGVVRVLEIGVWKGDTARGIRDRCKRNGATVDYYGIDAAPLAEPNPPFPGCHYIIGLSDQVAEQIPSGLHFVFVDGCHCRDHVVKDALIYGSKLACGGLMAFHDTAPQIQGIQLNRWVHGNEDRPEWRTNVLKAIQVLGWPDERWRLWRQAFDPKSDIGGIMVFKREF